jgi:hypothetical protein
MILSCHDSVASSSVGWVSGIPLTIIPLTFRRPLPSTIWLRLAALRFLRIFAAIQSKSLSLNHLHPKPSVSQSGPIKPNQVIFYVPCTCQHGSIPQQSATRSHFAFCILHSAFPLARSNPVKPSQTQSNQKNGLTAV